MPHREFRSELRQALIASQIRSRLSGEAGGSRACQGQVRPCRGKNPSHFLVTVDDRKHERGETKLGGYVEIRTRTDEHFDGPEVTVERGEHER